MVWAALPALSSRILSIQNSPSRGSSSDFIGVGRRNSPHPREFRTRSRPLKTFTVGATTLAFPSKSSAEELQDTYGRQGLRFRDLDGEVAAELKLENGCMARLMLATAQVTSYKAHMWHGGEEELLHTVRSGGNGKLNSESLRGGIDLRFCEGRDPPRSILPNPAECWSVEDVRCEPSNYAQITLTISSNPELGVTSAGQGALRFQYVVTLTDKSLSSALIITNTGLPPVELRGSIVTHLAVSSVEATFAVGLNGRRYLSLSRVAGERVDKILPTGNFFSRIWGSKTGAKPGEASSPKSADSESEGLVPESEPGRWMVENEDYSQLYGGDDRLYPTPPNSFTMMDRGFRRSLIVQRIGFEEFSLSNPGPSSERRDWDAFICMGPAQTTQAVRLLENEVLDWTLDPKKFWTKGASMIWEGSPIAYVDGDMIVK